MGLWDCETGWVRFEQDEWVGGALCLLDVFARAHVCFCSGNPESVESCVAPESVRGIACVWCSWDVAFNSVGGEGMEEGEEWEEEGEAVCGEVPDSSPAVVPDFLVREPRAWDWIRAGID